MGVLIGTLINSCLPEDRLCYLVINKGNPVLVVYMYLHLLGQCCAYMWHHLPDFLCGSIADVFCILHSVIQAFHQSSGRSCEFLEVLENGS